MVWFNVFLIYCQGQHVVLEGDLCKRLNEDNYKHFWFCTSSRNKNKKTIKKRAYRQQAQILHSDLMYHVIEILVGFSCSLSSSKTPSSVCNH